MQPFGKLTSDDLASFEQRNCLVLPTDYREFLIKNNGGKPGPLASRVSALNEMVMIDAFLGLTGLRGLDIQRRLDEYRDEIPPGFLIIAKDPRGNFFILGTRKSDPGVFYWDHTHAFKRSSQEGGNTYLIAKSFKEFFDALLPVVT
jgi:hypothetical protein